QHHSHSVFHLSSTYPILLSHQYLHFFFFFNAPATPEIYTLSLHDALPIYAGAPMPDAIVPIPDSSRDAALAMAMELGVPYREGRSEEHTSELQSRGHLVCRLLLEKKKKNKKHNAVIKTNRNNRNVNV